MNPWLELQTGRIAVGNRHLSRLLWGWSCCRLLMKIVEVNRTAGMAQHGRSPGRFSVKILEADTDAGVGRNAGSRLGLSMFFFSFLVRGVGVDRP